MLFAARRPQQQSSAAAATLSRLPGPPAVPRGSVPGSPTTASSSATSSQRGSAPGTPTATRRLASPRLGRKQGATATASVDSEHVVGRAASASAMPALRPGLGPKVNKLAKSASASSTRAMAAATASARASRPARPTSFPKPVVPADSASSPRPVIDSTTRESSPAAVREAWNPDGIEARHVGCRVRIAGEKTGTLRYFGPIALASGDFCGVELDEPDGKHDGTVRGVSYFRCAPDHGLLAPLHLVRLCGNSPSEATMALDSVDSGPHSILDLDLMMDNRMLEADEPPHRLSLEFGKDAFGSMASTPTSAAMGEDGGDTLSPSRSHADGLTKPAQQQPPHFLHLMEKQNSFDLDESLGILTPDQMADGFTVCDGSSPEEEKVATEAVDVHQVVEMVDSALRGVDVVHDVIADPAAVDDAEEAGLLGGSLLRDAGGALSTSDCISEDLASKAARSEGLEHGMERTPSVEELPLDRASRTPGVGTPGIVTPGVATPSRSARGGKTPNSIITSVTSIASLDTGYQGDGEWSRPGSRGAEGPDGILDADRHSPTAGAPLQQGIKIKGTAVDPMTDSDFFTESDADVQEERLGAAGRGGDRHAQVIDGTLYGGAGSNGGPAPPRPGPHAASDDMDSSGIYSDLERPQAPSVPAAGAFKEGRTLASLNHELVETLKSMLPVTEAPDQVADDRGAEDLGSMTSLVTVKSLQQQQQQQQQEGGGIVATAPPTSSPPKSNKTVREIKKYKMPNRNVTSKVKAMMVVTTIKTEDQENAAPHAKQRTPKKWEAVMQKIASNAEEQTSKLARLKDVKGKVLSSMGVSLTAPATAPHSARASRSNSISQAARKGSMLSSPRGTDQRKPKGRRYRAEGQTPPSVSETPIMSPDQHSTASTPRSSLSDVSRASSINNRTARTKKNRSSSPLSDVSTNSTTTTTRTKSATLPTPRATAHGGARERSSRDKADAATAEVLKKNQRNKTSVTPVLSRTDKAWGAAAGNGRLAERAAAKGHSPHSPSPRKATVQRRPAPLKDHNGRVQTEPVAKQNGVSAAPQPARRSLAASLRSSASPASPTAQTPSAQELAAQERKRLLPDLRHNAAAFEAMVVLLDYTTSKLGAFAAPALRKDVERIKAEMASTVLQLEEARAQQRLLESERAEQEERARAALAEVAEARAGQEQQQRDLDELRQRLSGHDHQVHKLSAAHADEVAALRGQLDARAVEAADAAAAATRGLREEYELELDRVTRRHEDTLRAALAAAREDAERQAQAQAQEAARREAELAAQLAAKEAAHEALREQSRRVMDSMKSDKDARTQALANRCRELQDEVDSLRSVLELRCDELQKSRRENDALRIAADQLPGAEQRISTLTARLEDLQVQLDRKGMLESKLLLENSELQQSFSKEIKEKQMLSLQNEQLQFKLKQNTEVVNVLAANMSDFHDVSSILNSSLTNSMTMTPDRGRRSAKGTSTINNNNRSTASPPESPRVKGVVEKSESVSYMLEMETDTPDDVVARIYRRMASTPVPSPHHAPHPRSAPPSARRSAALQQSASATTIPAQTSPARPTPKQRTTSASATSRTRSRSISSDSGECLSSGNWSPPASLPQLPSPPKQLEPPTQPHVAEARPENGLLAPGPGLGYDCSDIEDFSSSKSSSMSCSSEGSELGVGNKEHVEDEAGSDDGELAQQALFQQHQQDMMTASMTSCGSVTLPKDAGGEEMASGDDATNDIHSSCEEEDGSAGSCTGSDVDQDEDQGTRRARAEHRLAGLARLTLPTTPTAGCGQSAINTPLDSSWSEDMELPVSLSET